MNDLRSCRAWQNPWAALGASLLLSACGQADAPPPDQVPLRPVSAAGSPCPELAGHYQLQDPEAHCCGVQQDVLFFSPPALPASLPRDHRHAWQSVRIEGSPREALHLTWTRMGEEPDEPIRAEHTLHPGVDYRCEAGWLVSPAHPPLWRGNSPGPQAAPGRWADEVRSRVRPDMGAGLMVQTQGKVWQTFTVYAGSPGVGYWYSTDTVWTRFPPAENSPADRAAAPPAQGADGGEQAWLRSALPAGVQLESLSTQGRQYNAVLTVASLRQYDALLSQLNARADMADIRMDITNPQAGGGRMEVMVSFQRL